MGHAIQWARYNAQKCDVVQVEVKQNEKLYGTRYVAEEGRAQDRKGNRSDGNGTKEEPGQSRTRCTSAQKHRQRKIRR